MRETPSRPYRYRPQVRRSRPRSTRACCGGTVAARAAPRLETSITRDGAEAIACRARGIPRLALTLLERARDLAQAQARSEITGDHVAEAAKRLGYDEHGLLPEDRKIISLLIARGRPMGIGSIAAALREDPETLARVNEPYLLEQGFITVTEQGRDVTAKARRLFGQGTRP